MKVMATGRSGQLARSLAERSAEHEIIPVGRPDLDLEVPGSAETAIRRILPEVVINAAAYTNVDDAEDEPERAFRINADAAGEVAETANLLGIPVIHLSTDYVFDGASSTAYDEDAPVAPLGVYGHSKLAGEERVRGGNSRHLIIRTAWVYSPFGRNFVKTIFDATNDRDAVDFPQNPLNYRPEYAEARTSRPHIFTASYVYELPFFSKDANGFKRTILGGWQFSGITDIESGQPVARVGLASAQPQTGLTGFYPNEISNPAAGLAKTIDPATGLPFVFDPTAFAVPANGTYGSAPRAFARLFGRNQTNFSLIKNIYFDKEQGVRLQLRAEAFNAFNHTQFTGVGTVFATTGTAFGRPTGTRLPREFQFGAKLYF